jgi:choline dehydrogenase-like flavoprotein
VFRDARTVEQESTLECDVCIVGTGAAGVTVALALAAGDHRVLVLEAGGLEPDRAAASSNEVEAGELPVSPSSRQRFFGGTTNSWWGKVGLLDEHDFLARDWLGASGWPIRRSDLDPYYREACGLLDMPDLLPFATSAAGGRSGEYLRSETLDTKTFFWTRHALNFGELLRRRSGRARKLSVLLHATVTEILLDESGRVDRLAVATTGGRRFYVRPGVAILACGGIENSRLLLNSTSRRPAGVGNAFDQVGRYYMDHPRGPCGEVEAMPALSRLSAAYWSGKRFGSVRFRLGVSLSPEAQARQAVLNSYVNLSPVYGGGAGGGVEAVRTLYRRGPAALARPRTLLALAGGVPDIVRYFRFKRYGRGRVRALTVENYTEQEPRAVNRVTLSDRRDPFGHPLAKVTYSLSELDRRTLRSLHETLASELARRGMGLLHSPILAGDPDPWPVSGDAAHHMGGTRMGSSPAASVVDSDCRVHGVENLYVAGSSVFPTGGSANPTLTIMALAGRLAARVRSTLQHGMAVRPSEATPNGPTPGRPDIGAEKR